MFIFLNKNDIIKAISETSLRIQNTETIETHDLDNIDKKNLVGKKALLGPEKDPSEYRVAFICNWGEACGIATYTQALVSEIRNKVKEVRIFAEAEHWHRGESMSGVIKEIADWKPDVIHIEHEFGIFPKANHFLKMLEDLEPFPYIVTFHSVYEHLDKTICTAYVKNTIVHSEEAKDVLRELGHLNDIYIVPHGCAVYDDVSELWNIFQNDYTVIQFGFGFTYKGVDMAVDAIKHLKESDPKFKDLFYCYLCSENPHTRSVHEEYYSYLKNRVDEAGLSEHVAIMRGFISDKIIRNFLRTAKLAIFPYKTDPSNRVYGASGAVRHAMANGIPVIGSDSHMFDDLNGIIPRISDPMSLAHEIDKIFSDGQYKKELVDRNLDFLKSNDWSITADRHLEVYKAIVTQSESRSVRIINYTVVNS